MSYRIHGHRTPARHTLTFRGFNPPVCFSRYWPRSVLCTQQPATCKYYTQPRTKITQNENSTNTEQPDQFRHILCTENSRYHEETYDELKDECKSVLCVNNVVKCDDVGVLEALQ